MSCASPTDAIPEGFALDPGKSTLGVKISSEAGEHFGEFKLEKVTESRAELSKGLFSGNVMGTEYTLKIEAQSKDEFRKLQGYFTLLVGAEVPMEGIRAANAGR